MEQNGIDAVTDHIVSRGAPDVIYAWCATHPRSYSATIRSSARARLAAYGRDVYCLPTYHHSSNTCLCSLRVDRRGIFMNDFAPSVPLWRAVWQVRLLYRLFGKAVEVSVVDLDALSLEALLLAWESTEVKVRSITSKRCLTACLSTHRRTTGGVFTALTDVQELALLPSPYEDAALAVMEHLPSLRCISANGCCVEYLKPLRYLYQLNALYLAQTQIRDRELRILAELPLLATLDVSACAQLTSLDPLSQSPSLRVLSAANCERLVRMSQLGAVATLRDVDLSENVFLPAELATFLTRQSLLLHMGNFSHLRWPRDDPPAVQNVLNAATHLTLSYCTIPNIRWLCGAYNLEQLFLNHTNVTAVDLKLLVPHIPFLRVLSLSFCERLKTNLDFVQSLGQLTILTISRSSLPTPFTELEDVRRSLTVTVT